MTIEILPPGSNLFTSDAEVLVNPVDAVTGAQGKGLAKLFAKRFPAASSAYRSVAQRGNLDAGDVWVHDIGPHALTQRWIFFAATKYHWRNKSTIENVARAARHIRQEALVVVAKSIAIPALGCGEGGLRW